MRGFTAWIRVLSAVVVVGVVGAVLFPAFIPDRHPSRSPCQTNLKNIGLAVQMYLQDADQCFPAASGAGSRAGWMQALQPYWKPTGQISQESTDPFQCPEVYNGKGFFDSSPSTKTDYFMNRRLLGIDQSGLSNSALTILNGEGDDEMDALSPHYVISAIPKAWTTGPASPAQRHLGGANFGFTDGHVKWFKIGKVSGTATPDAGGPTFLPFDAAVRKTP